MEVESVGNVIFLICGDYVQAAHFHLFLHFFSIRKDMRTEVKSAFILKIIVMVRKC